MNKATRYKSYHYVKGEARNPFKLNNTYILFIYKVFKHLLMQWMSIWMNLYGHQNHGGGLKWLNHGNNWVQTYHYNYDLVEVRKHIRLNYTSILYIYTVLKHLPIQWTVIQMNLYFIKAMGVG